jgi:tetratricopeptide (TPR) repeat protein
LPGAVPMRSLLFLPGRFSRLQVLLKTGDSCRLVLADAISDNELGKRVKLLNGTNASFPNLTVTETRYSSTQESKEVTRTFVWNGTAYERQGLKEAAELNRQALAHLASGAILKAIELLNQAYDLVGGGNVELVNNLGFAYYKQWHKSRDQKYFDDAVRHLLEAINLDRNRWQAYLNLADLYNESGKKTEALEFYQQAEKLNPNKTSAAKIRKKIDALRQRTVKPLVLAEVLEKIGPNLPLYKFKLLGDPETRTVQRITITDASTNKVIQYLDVENDDEGSQSHPGVDDFSLDDINFDGYKDIGLLVACGGTGNCDSSFWLFNPRTRQFAFSKDFEGLGTLTLDPKKKQINTHSNGGHAGMIHSDSTYEVRNNAPVLIREVNQDYDDKKGYYVEITKELVKGTMKITNRRIVPAP